MRTLVTGATGLVGAALVRRLVEAGEDLRIMRREHSKLDLLGPATNRVEHFVGDVTDVASLSAAMSGVQRVYHVAARIGYGGRRDRRNLEAVNVVGTGNVVSAALEAGVERLVHTSSMAAFGRVTDGEAINEETAWHESRLNTYYAESKYKAELEVHRGIAEGLDAVIVNPALIFGVGRPGENTRQIIDTIRFRKLPAVPAGSTNVVDVLDVVSGHIRAMNRGTTGSRYFLGSENLTWRTIADTIAQAFDVRPPRFTMSPGVAMLAASAAELAGLVLPSRPLLTREAARQSARSFHYDNTKARQELECRFRPFDETMARIAASLANSKANA